MREEIAVNSHEFATLAEPLPPALQQGLCLAMELEHITQNVAGGDLRMDVGQDDGCAGDVLDRLIAGIGCGDPGGQACDVGTDRERRAGLGYLAVVALGEEEGELAARWRGRSR